jgi:methylenetetrahydrofolate dehydrogenase (NADP+)/methenyltetrahydrofolate cyclohydrolase
MILDGKLVAQKIKDEIRAKLKDDSCSRKPHLTIITVGEDPASKVYVRNKIKACEEVGIKVNHYIANEKTTTQDNLKKIIYAYNKSSTIDGIMVQLPLPEGFDERDIIDAIDPAKDVDGLTTTNIGKLRSGQECLKPCTAAGIIDLCKYYNIELDGKDVTIIGRSNIVGKPLADMMMSEGATVTQCHSRTQQLSYHTKMADIVVCAVGKPKMLTGRDVWDADAVIDVGINRDENGKLCGDVDYDDIIEHRMDTINITPVPGGVGPMTVAELMKNTVECWRKNI